MKFKKKSIGVLFGVVVVATALFAYGPGWGGHMRGRADGNYDSAFSEEFYEQHSNLLEENQEKAEDIYDTIEDNHEAIEDEVENKNPNWDKVSKLMDQQHELRADLMELRKQEKLQLLKDADYVQRQELISYGGQGYFGNCAGGNYRRGFRGRRGRGHHHYNNDDYDRNRSGRGRGHMMGR